MVELGDNFSEDPVKSLPQVPDSSLIVSIISDHSGNRCVGDGEVFLRRVEPILSSQLWDEMSVRD